MTASADPPPASRARKQGRRCPICGKPRSEAHAPFCSIRCRDRDLMQWLGDGYAIPGEPAAIPTDRFEEDE